MNEQISWTYTKVALEQLFSFLNCSSCTKTLKEPCSFELCNHYFCRECAVELADLGSKCPLCDAVLWREHLQMELKIPEVLSICNKLKTLLYKDEHRVEFLTNAKSPTPLTCDDETRKITSQELKDVAASIEVNKDENQAHSEMEEGTYVFQPLEQQSNAVEEVDQSPETLTVADDECNNCNNDLSTNDITEHNMQEDVKINDKSETIEPLHFEGKENISIVASKFESPPRSQFSNALSDDDIAQGAQRNPTGVKKKPRFTYGKNSKRLKKEEEEKSETCAKNDDTFSVFDFCSSGETTATDKKPDSDKVIPPEISSEILNERKTSCNKKRRKSRKKITIPEKKSKSLTSAADTGTSLKEQNTSLSNEITKEQETSLSKEVPNERKNSNKKESMSVPLVPKKQNKSIKNLEKKNRKGETALHTACIKGNLERVNELIQLGAETNTKDYAGWTPLHEACNHGRLEIVKSLLDSGALIDIVGGEDNDTPLHDAVSNNRPDVVKLLLTRGAPISVRNKSGLLPSDYAVTADMKQIFKDYSPSEVVNSTVVTFHKKFVLSEDVNVKVQVPMEVGVSNISFDTTNPDMEKIILTTNITAQQKKMVDKCCSLLGGKVLKDLSEKDSDNLCPNRTMKYLIAMLTGKWILTYEWLSESLKAKKWLAECDYEVTGAITLNNEAPRRSRINHFKTLPKLFDGISFYFSGSFNEPPKAKLVDLVKLGGGKMLLREPKTSNIDPLITPLSPALHKMKIGPKHSVPTKVYHAKETSSQACCVEYIIYDAKNAPGHKRVSSPVLCTAPVVWLLDCISNFEILDVRDEHELKEGFTSSQSK